MMLELLDQPSLLFVPGDTSHLKAEFDVLLDSSPMETERTFWKTTLRLGPGGPAKLPIDQHVAARGRRLQSSADSHQGRLAATRRSDDADELTLLDVQGAIIDRTNSGILRAEPFCYVSELELGQCRSLMPARRFDLLTVIASCTLPATFTAMFLRHGSTVSLASLNRACRSARQDIQS